MKDLEQILPLMQMSKNDMQELTSAIVSKMEEGELDVLKTHVQIKSMEKILKQLKEAAKLSNQN